MVLTIKQRAFLVEPVFRNGENYTNIQSGNLSPTIYTFTCFSPNYA